MFLAEQMTKELVMNGRLPEFNKKGDHIARYGKGFSQMLGVASPTQTNSRDRLTHIVTHGGVMTHGGGNSWQNNQDTADVT